MDAIEVRPSVEADFEEYLALFEEVAAEGLWIGAEAPVSRDWTRRGFESRLHSEHATEFVAEADGVLVGDLHVTLALGVAELGMMVRDGCRGQGVGSALMDACLVWCRARRAHKVVLSVWPHNEAAIALYRKYGFVVEGRSVRHWRRRSGELWDLVDMALVLDTTSPGSPHPDARAAGPLGGESG